MQVNVGKGIELDIDLTAFSGGYGDLAVLCEKVPAVSHIVMIGLRNVLMDCHASVTAAEYPNEAERQSVARAAVDKKLAALMSGEVRVSSSREGDPVRAEAKAMAEKALRAKIKAAGKKWDDFEKDARSAAIQKLITPELLAQAKARVDQTKSVAGDLADLGL